MSKLKVFAALSAVAFLSGCEPPTAAQVAAQASHKPFYGTTAYHDDLRNVTCWKVDSVPGGLSCLPDWMLVAPRGGNLVHQ